MSHQLSRIRLIDIGDRAARFPDTTLDLAAPAGTTDSPPDGSAAAGDPLDSILWLRNGGGKSSLLSLFFALVLPLRRDFLGAGVKRHLEDYIADGDTSHTVAEWADMRSAGLFDAGQRLVTGAVYEWDERRRPTDPERNRDKLKVAYYAFIATPGLLTLDSLPVTDESGRPIARAEYLRQLRDLAAAHPQQLQLVTTEAPVAWMTALTDRHLDPALFRYQKRMNHSEGGVAELFTFDTTAKFIDLLIDLTVDPAQPERVAANLGQIADIISAKPRHQRGIRFCETLTQVLDRLAAEHDGRTAALAGTRTAVAAARELTWRLAGAAAAHAERARILAESLSGLLVAQRDADRDRARLGALNTELLLRAEQFRHTAAVTEHTRSLAVVEDATRTAHAWEATEPLADRLDAIQAAARLRRELDAEQRANAPRREEHDQAALALRARHRRLAAEERDRAELATADGEYARETAQELRAAQRSAGEQRAEARAQRSGVEAQIQAVAEAITAAVRAGDLPADGEPGAHADQADADLAAARERLQQLHDAQTDRVEQRRTVNDRRAVLTGVRATRAAEQAAARAEVTRLTARVDALAGHGRLHELLQLDGGWVDLWADPVGLRAALTHAAAAADAAVVAAAVDDAEDVRALNTLVISGYLPTTRDAQRVAEALSIAGIVARPGWELLRTLVDDADRAVVLRNSLTAALACGVVVADDDLDDAHRTLADPALTTIAHVPVCTAARLQHVVAAARADTMTDSVIEAAGWAAAAATPALYHPGAADTDRSEREQRRTTRDQEVEAWTAQAAADRALLAELDQLLADCPAGHLGALRTDLATLDDAVAALNAQLDTLAAAAAQLDADEEVDGADQALLSERLSELTGKLTRLRGLAEQVAGLDPLHRRSAELAEDITRLGRTADDLDKAAAVQEASRDAALTLAAGAVAAAERHDDDAAAINLLGGIRAEEQAAVGGAVDGGALVGQGGATGTGAGTDTGPHSDDPAVPLSVLRSRYVQAQQAWAQVTADSVLADRLNREVSRIAAAQQRLAEFSPDAISQADELLQSVDGQDGRRRRHAFQAARAALETANVQATRADTDASAAAEEVGRLAALRERERRPVELEIEPFDEADARDQADRYATAATAASERATAARAEYEATEKAIAAASAAKGVFDQLVARLRDAASTAAAELPDAASGTPADGTDGGAGRSTAFAGSPEEGGEVVAAVVAELTGAAATTRATTTRVQTAVQAVRAAAAGFTGIEDPLKQRFTTDSPDQVAALARERARQLRERRQVLLGLLADIGRDQDLVVTQIAGLVGDVFTILAGAQRHSRLPGSLGRWAGQQFLTIRFTRPGSGEDLRARISAVVDRIVAEGSKPEGLSLLKRCVHEAAAPRGFSVTVLKPNSSLTVEPLGITLLGKYSGGEKLTVCVALYCTLARLRAVNRGHGHVGGTLVLDNPLGTASHVELLRLQRDVAAAHGVQLVFTTGVEDFGAVGQFPNIVRLRNTPGTLRHRRYVTVESRSGTGVDATSLNGATGSTSEVTAVRVARTAGGPS